MLQYWNYLGNRFLFVLGEKKKKDMYSSISYDYANTDQISLCSWETSECSCFNMKSWLVVFTSTFALQADSVSYELSGKPKRCRIGIKQKTWPYMWDSKRDTYVKNRLLDSVGEGKGAMIWENSIETCILSYVKQIASPGSMNETGCSGLVHSNDPEGWDGEGYGRGFRMGNTCTPMADSCQCMAKTTTIL